TSAGTVQITGTVIDSRGRTAQTTQEIEVIPYFDPTITTNIYRCDAEGYEDGAGNNVNITILSKNYSSINNLNSITSIKVQYKKTTETTWSTATAITGTEIILQNLSSDYAYNIQLTVQDALGGTS